MSLKLAARPASSREPTFIANTPCCVCGETASQPVFSTTFEKARSPLRTTLNRLRYSFGAKFNTLRHPGVFHMRQCDGCKLLFCSPRLSDEGIARLYDSNYYVFSKTDAACFSRTAEIYNRTVRLLPEDATRPGRVLEIGSGKGYLLAALNGLGWDALGIEISEDAARYAREIFGVDTFTGTIESYLAAQPAAQPFASVLCIDIIEHVLDPDAFVAGLARVTAAGGYLVIDTPNGDAAHIAIEGASWRGFNPFHIFLFNRANLTTLLRKHGFEVREALTYNNVLERPPKPSPIGAHADTLESCVSACRAAPGFAADPDASAALAAELRGENLVLIAQKVEPGSA